MTGNQGPASRHHLPPYVRVNSGPTPDRPPLPRRTPGQTDIERDPRFRLLAARGVAAPDGDPQRAPLDGVAAAMRNRPDADALDRARETVAGHMPSRLAECRVCDVAAFCPPFTSALAVLDRWDQVKARRVRAVLQYAGLWPDGYVHDGRDD
ncbi:hypothetical protein O7621_24865 [Solwaraspora sp. WMMD937]|uniref:hypothetical protein n=1 Tax=Solwaraspora sp. WMMD937 TaxID=3016090 RepID=UPI00249B9945|nr:hypothetical protein [Solwaraspora sp. WMMD937]WFE21054.1 hypothetical protein O7621_24865 [Solwaraspora sp. WMMD937]